MKITDIKAHLLKPQDNGFRWKEEWEPRTFEYVFLRILADNGLEGQCIAYLLPWAQLEAELPKLKALLIGRDPHEVEAISYQLTDRLREPGPVSSHIDICLWDLLGKHHGEPVYKLMGAARHRIKAYASTTMYDTVPEYVEVARRCYEEGFRALKIHAFAVPDKDIEVCRAVHKAFGDKMLLMLDPVNAYDRVGAFKVGKVLEELDWFWYECPIPDTDLLGLKDLTRSFKIPIAGAESVRLGLRGLPIYLSDHIIDSVRSIGDFIGGISALKKCAALCEAFNVNYETHSYGTTLIQAAHLHVMLATHNCDLFEIPVPQGVFDIGMKDVIRVESDGFVSAPKKPGLGYDVDWDEIKRLTLRQV